MARNRPMVIDIWQGDWGLPSIDVECLKVLTIIKFSGLDYEVKKTNNPFWAPNGSLPVVHQGKHTYTSYDEVLSYLILKNVNPDHGLTTVQEAESVAYITMLEEKLYPALQYIWWIEEKNYASLTRPWYSKALPFPFNFYYTPKYLKKAQKLIEALHGTDLSSAEIETQVYNEAEKCLTTLSVRLGESEFMYGSHPTTLDAVMFAYLAPLLKAPFKNPILQNHLKACTNLYKFVSKINLRYFSKDYKEYEGKIKEEAVSGKPNDPERDYPSTVIAALFAVIAMLSYAFSVGILQRAQIEDNYDEEGYYSGDNYEEDN